jgi:hypothetical protein
METDLAEEHGSGDCKEEAAVHEMRRKEQRMGEERKGYRSQGEVGIEEARLEGSKGQVQAAWSEDWEEGSSYLLAILALSSLKLPGYLRWPPHTLLLTYQLALSATH